VNTGSLSAASASNPNPSPDPNPHLASNSNPNPSCSNPYPDPHPMPDPHANPSNPVEHPRRATSRCMRGCRWRSRRHGRCGGPWARCCASWTTPRRTTSPTSPSCRSTSRVPIGLALGLARTASSSWHSTAKLCLWHAGVVQAPHSSSHIRAGTFSVIKVQAHAASLDGLHFIQCCAKPRQ